MYSSETFGRLFWVDDDYEFKSCPQNIDGTGDFDCQDYVSEWTDWEGVNMEILFNIYRCELINKVEYAGSLTHKETEVPIPDNTLTTKNESNMNTYDEQFYKEIVKDSKVEIIPDGKHMCGMECADKVNQVFGNFLNDG